MSSPKTNATNIFDHLLNTAQDLYQRSGYTYSDPVAAAESADYAAYTFTINNTPVIYRVAKITPTKIGQFVTLWQRNPQGIIQPISLSDPADFIIIITSQQTGLGQFIFPKKILYEKGIISGDGKVGKLGFRVYPQWDQPTSKQAQKTQGWQTAYFMEISGKEKDIHKVKFLLGEL